MVKAILLALCVATTASGQSTADARKAYGAYLDSLRAALLRSDANAVAALVTDDRTSVGSSGQVMKGRAAQLAADKAFFAGSFIRTFEVHVTDFHSSGSLAYATGTDRHVVVDRTTGTAREDAMQFVEIMVREDDGRWRSQFYMNAPLARR